MAKASSNAGKKDAFDPTCMREIGKLLGTSDGRKLERFSIALAELATKYRKIISDTPLNMRGAPMDKSLTRRREWLNRRVIDPCNLLLAALGKQNRPLFSTWPDAKPPAFPDAIVLADGLKQLRDFALSLDRSLQGDIDEKINHTFELKFAIVYDLVETLRDHFPDVSVTRGNYDRDLRRHIGAVPDFVERAFREITGLREKHDKSLQLIIEQVRKEESHR